jgi:Ribosomal proteins 50S-L15, 50S-L18e, 60S-L27A
MPLIRRLPKRGFNNAAFHKTYAVVNLSDLNDFKTGSVVNEQVLREANLVRGHVAGVKLLGNGELKHALKIEVDKVSGGAREKIDKAGGTIELRKPKAKMVPSDAGGTEAAPESAATETENKPKSPRKAASKGGARAKKTKSKKG